MFLPDRANAAHLDALALDEVTLLGPVWQEIARSGAHHGRSGGRSISLSSDDILSMVRGFAKVLAEGWFSRGAPVGVNHAAVAGAVDAESTKAMGYITEVRSEASPDGTLSLMGLIDYTAEGRKRVRAGEFQGFSIEAIPSAHATSKRTGEAFGEWALIGGTLTNAPMIPGMAALAASETAAIAAPLEPTMIPPAILSALGLPEDADEAAVLAKIEAMKPSEDEAPAVEAEAVAASERVLAMGEAVAVLTGERDQLKSEVVALSEWKTARMLDDACAAGRIDAAGRDRYLRIVTALGEAEAHAIFPSGKVKTAPVSGSGGKSATPQGALSMSDVAAEVLALSEQIAKDEGRSPADAFAEASRRVLSDSTRRAVYDAAITA